MSYEQRTTPFGPSGAAALAEREHPVGTGSRARTVRAHRETVQRVIRTMRQRFGEPLSLDDMARVAHSSPYHFSRVFRRVTGASPVQYLAAVRLEAAKRLLLTTPFSVASVCFEVGYNSVGTFTTLFTALVGVSPRRLRRMDEGALECVLRSLPDLVEGGITAPAARSAVQVRAPADFAGPVFVGLFREAIPRGRPAACAVLDGPGTAFLPPVPDGRYHLFAAGLARADGLVDAVVCAGALRASGGRVVASGGAIRVAALTLRPGEPTDPPLLPALPCLLEERLARGRAPVPA
ncbi:MAG TPA: AraC family transcriptional regulator [Longimicrobiaceae bacterium]|nr:AraC family transcriptional regulator [Longimicrobiaceae bacterium]